jgi:hypothetical protein
VTWTAFGFFLTGLLAIAGGGVWIAVERIEGRRVVSEATGRADRYGVTSVTPGEFERVVATLLASLGPRISGLSLSHQERVQGTDGDFVIDADRSLRRTGCLLPSID